MTILSSECNTNRQNELPVMQPNSNNMNLQNSNNILDQILNNLQGLTPEQEIQKKKIE